MPRRARLLPALVVVLLLLFPVHLLAQDSPEALSVYPVVTPVTQNVSSGPFTAKFVVSNTYTFGMTVTPNCQAGTGLSCGSVTPSSFYSSGNGSQDTVSVQYSTGTPGGTRTLTLHAYHDDEMVPNPASGDLTVQVVGAPVLTLVVPVLTSGSRAVVSNRQPTIRALFTPNGSPIDTSQTVLKWRGTTITALARRNRGLLEWEVDSTRWLGLTGDSAEIYVKACSQSGHCSDVTRWAVLPADDTPVLAFTGMPAGTLGSGYGAPFGPGLSVQQAEVEAGFGVPGYVSMGAARSAGLVYSTRQSYPRAIVLVDLELRWPVGTPDQVKLRLKEGAVTLDSLILSSPTCATGATRRCRASLQADYSGSTFATPTRKWLKVEAQIVSGVTTKSSTDSVEVVLVDRRTTYYGSGWWPAGISQLVAAGNDRLLVSPTGTATIYRGSGDSVYIPPAGSFTELAKFVNRFELQPRGTSARVRFNISGWLIATEDINGNKDSVVYSGSSGKVTKFRDAVGKELSFSYDGNDKLSTITDPGSRQSKISINGGTYQLTYDSLSSPTTRPIRTTWVYQTYPGTGTVVLTKRIGVITDTTAVTYDSTFRRRPVQATLPLVQNPAGSWVNPTIGYTAYERRGFGALVPLDSAYVQMTDPRGFWTKSLLTRWGQGTRTWDELGLLGKSVYDPEGYLLWSEGKNGDSSRTYQVYDTFKRAVKSYIVRAVGDTLRGDSLVYNSSHWVTAVIDNRGKVTSNTYDGVGRLTRTISPNSDTTSFWYRSDGLVDSMRLPSGTASQRYTYEGTWKQVLRVIDPTGDTLTINAYDNLGRLDSAVSKIKGDTLTGKSWQKVQHYYDVASRVDSSVSLRTTTSGAASPTWPSLTDTTKTTWSRVRYDVAGRDSVRINNRGYKTRYVYDRLGRLTARYPWADSSVAIKDSMVYDLAGNVVKTITRRGQEITANFDSRNRDTLAVVPGVGTIRKAFGGPQDQLTRVWATGYVDSIGGVVPDRAWRYDQRGRLLTDTSFTGSTARTLVYAYDSYERNYRTTDALGQWDTEYETNRGYPVKLKTPLADTLEQIWDYRSRPDVFTLSSNGVKVSFDQDWNAAGALLEITTMLGPTPWLAGKWKMLGQTDANSAIHTRWYEKKGSGAATDSTTNLLGYDGEERLTAWDQYHNGSDRTETYAFDATANLAGPTYVPRTDQLTGDGTWAYTYDHAGNLVGKTAGGVTWVYGYDGLNRLVSARRNGTVIVRYGYDVTGRRIAKRVYSSASGGTVAYTRFVYRGAHVAFETDSAGTTGLKYVWGVGTDELVGFQDGAGNHYYVARDKLGSIRNVATRSGTWVMRLRYTPYGTTIDSAGTGVALWYRWTGREWDAETGMYYFRARYYDPAIMRFVQEDPIGYAGGENLYAYVQGSPLEATDPSGMLQHGRSARSKGWDWQCCSGSGWDGWFGIIGSILPTKVTVITAIGSDGTRERRVVNGHLVDQATSISFDTPKSWITREKLDNIALVAYLAIAIEGDRSTLNRRVSLGFLPEGTTFSVAGTTFSLTDNTQVALGLDRGTGDVGAYFEGAVRVHNVGPDVTFTSGSLSFVSGDFQARGYLNFPGGASVSSVRAWGNVIASFAIVDWSAYGVFGGRWVLGSPP